MKNYSIKELNLGVGIEPHSAPRSTKNKFITNGGFHTSADSVIAQRHSLVNEEEDEESEEELMKNDDILECRIYKNNSYQLLETLERIDEGFFQKLADLAKAVPGLDQFVGDIELYLQAGNAKEVFDGLTDIISSLGHAAGSSALGVIGTDSQYEELLGHFKVASEQDKARLKEGVEEILEVLKQMTITAVQTFDSIIALPAFAGTPVAGAIGEVGANLVTFMTTNLRSLPVDQFVFKLVTERSGIISKIIALFEGVMTAITAGGTIGKALGYVVGKITKTGGEIVTLLLTKPFELFRRLGDLYKVSSGIGIESDDSDTYQADVGNSNQVDVVSQDDLNVQLFEFNGKYSLLPLLETLEQEENVEQFDEIDLEKYDEDIDEAITVAGAFGATSPGAGHGGRIGPLGDEDRGSIYDKKRKAVQEQIERMRILESYHYKTTNRLK